MARYIDADELKKNFQDELCKDIACAECSMQAEGFCRAERWIEIAPTADVDYERGFIEGYTKAESDIFHGGKYAPVKHGRWLHNKLWGTECSECGSAMFELLGVRYTTCKPKYCPNCGAKMDEVK